MCKLSSEIAPGWVVLRAFESVIASNGLEADQALALALAPLAGTPNVAVYLVTNGDCHPIGSHDGNGWIHIEDVVSLEGWMPDWDRECHPRLDALAYQILADIRTLLDL